MSNISNSARQAAERLFEDKVFAATIDKKTFVACYAKVIQTAIDAATADKEDTFIEELDTIELGEARSALRVVQDQLYRMSEMVKSAESRIAAFQSMADAQLHPEEKRK